MIYFNFANDRINFYKDLLKINKQKNTQEHKL